MKFDLKKGIMILSLIMILLTTVSFISANENNTSTIAYQTEENIENNLEIKTDMDDYYSSQNNIEENCTHNFESDKLQLTSEDKLGYDYISDHTFEIDTTQEKNYGTLTIKGAHPTIYLAKGYGNWYKYTAKTYYSYNKGKYSTITIELPKIEGKHQYRLATHYNNLADIDYFNINIKYKSFLTITNASVDIGKQASVNIKITANSYYASNITININGQTYTLSKSSTKFTTTITKPGHYVGTAKLNLNGYATSSEKFYINVYEEPLIVAQDYYITILGQEYKLNIYVVNSNGDPINGGKLYLNDTSAPVKNGYAQFILNPKDIAFDYYTIKYTPGSSSYYKSISIKNAFPIATISATKLTIDPINTIAGTKIKNIKYTITDSLGDKINPSGYFLINGKKYNSLKDFKAPKKGGTYKYTVKFVPDLILYANSTATLKIVNKIKTKVKVKSVSGYENKNVKITAIVKDNLGKNVKKGTVTFKIRGKSYKAKVKNGKATKIIKVPKPGSRGIYYYYYNKNGREIQKSVYESETYKCKVIFKGDSNYIKSSSTFKVTSKKKSTSNYYHTPYNPPSESPSSSSKKTTTKKSNTKTTGKSYGYYPTYHKPQPCLNPDLFKKEPAINTNNIKISDIQIIV